MNSDTVHENITQYPATSVKIAQSRSPLIILSESAMIGYYSIKDEGQATTF